MCDGQTTENVWIELKKETEPSIVGNAVKFDRCVAVQIKFPVIGPFTAGKKREEKKYNPTTKEDETHSLDFDYF